MMEAFWFDFCWFWKIVKVIRDISKTYTFEIRSIIRRYILILKHENFQSKKSVPASDPTRSLFPLPHQLPSDQANRISSNHYRPHTIGMRAASAHTHTLARLHGVAVWLFARLVVCSKNDRCAHERNRNGQRRKLWRFLWHVWGYWGLHVSRSFEMNYFRTTWTIIVFSTNCRGGLRFSPNYYISRE